MGEMVTKISKYKESKGKHKPDKNISSTKFFVKPQIGIHRAVVQHAFVANLNKVWSTAL